MSNPMPFKSQSESERSGDILVSFSSRWIDRLRGNFPNYIFRRRVPSSFVPKRVFVYVASPISEIIGFFNAKYIQQITLPEALNIASEAQIDADELKKYFRGYNTVGCYAIHDNMIFDEAIKLSELREHFDFFPPQSFVALSYESSGWIDKKLSKPPLQDSLSKQADGTLRGGFDESKI
ncbi:hypothetical protein [Mesorhizobium sp. BE184]|uniref:hypothetical protein n=1 Tax=Mesorhizobium sp. BE184 TaxID=2817714 RepID=UPI002861FF39|nr:hypothetical protein [Mesorhizobium sp. BE184]MDR7033108.1 putative transcriptional regulator [Mesorhizobium sp. BE184]